MTHCPFSKAGIFAQRMLDTNQDRAAEAMVKKGLTDPRKRDENETSKISVGTT